MVEKFLEFLGRRHALMVVLGTVLIVLGLSGGVSYGQFHLPIDGAEARVAAFVAGLLFVGLAFVSLQPHHLSAANVANLGIEIVSPVAHATIARKIDVRVTAKKMIPRNFKLYILRGYPEMYSSGFVPSAELVPSADGKTWDAQQFDMGGESGSPRRVEVWVVGPNGMRLIQTWLEASEVQMDATRQLRTLDPKLRAKPLRPIGGATSDMYRAHWIPVTRV